MGKDACPNAENTFGLVAKTPGFALVKGRRRHTPACRKSLTGTSRQGRAGKTIMNYQEALAALCDWCKRHGYRDKNPLDGLAPFDTTPQTIRRAMTPEEIEREKRRMAEIRLKTITICDFMSTLGDFELF